MINTITKSNWEHSKRAEHTSTKIQHSFCLGRLPRTWRETFTGSRLQIWLITIYPLRSTFPTRGAVHLVNFRGLSAFRDTIIFLVFYSLCLLLNYLIMHIFIHFQHFKLLCTGLNGSPVHVWPGYEPSRISLTFWLWIYFKPVLNSQTLRMSFMKFDVCMCVCVLAPETNAYIWVDFYYLRLGFKWILNEF